MRNMAVALARVSTAKQRVEGDSIESQKKHVIDFAADVLSCPIEKTWEVDVSAKKGANITRKDLREIYAYCKSNKHIKYFIVDKVNRLVREVKVFYWYIVELENLGVKTYFADPKYRDLNGDDQIAELKRFLAAYEAEGDNRERSETTLIRMKDRALLGYYPRPPHQGYIITNTPGLHTPDGKPYELLQKAFRAIASGQMDKYQAFDQLNKEGYKTPTGKPLRIDLFTHMLMDSYYAGFINFPNWGDKFVGIKGLHTPMITEPEFNSIQNYLKGRKTRRVLQHNPEFPLANILYCECGAKFTGLMQGNGKGNFYPRYRCRGCGRLLKRENIHKGIEGLLEGVVFPEGFKDKIMQSLETVWREAQKQNVAHINNLKTRLTGLEEQKSGLVISLTRNPELEEDIKSEIDKLKKEIKDTQSKIDVLEKSLGDDLIEFADFALNYIEDKPQQFWTVEYDERERCKQLLFPGEIYVNSEEKVYTRQISPFLCLNGIKKEVQNTSKSVLVGPVGIEPTTNRL